MLNRVNARFDGAFDGLGVLQFQTNIQFRQQAMHGPIKGLARAGIGFAHSQITEQIELSKSRIHQMQRDIDQFKPQLEQVALAEARAEILALVADADQVLARGELGGRQLAVGFPIPVVEAE